MPRGKFWLFSLLDCRKITLPHLKGKLKLTLFKKVSKVVHLTDFFLYMCSMYSHSEFKLINNNTIFTLSEIQTIDNGLSQPHFQGLFSPQQQLILKRTQHWTLLEPFYLFARQYSI